MKSSVLVWPRYLEVTVAATDDENDGDGEAEGAYGVALEPEGNAFNLTRGHRYVVGVTNGASLLAKAHPALGRQRKRAPPALASRGCIVQP